jgi:transposase
VQVRTLLPDARALCCESIQWDGQRITVVVRSVSVGSPCPCCGKVSERIHSRYLRRLADLPWQGAVVAVHWHSRRFFCDHPSCVRRIFTERLPEVAAPRARKSARLTVALRAIAVACGGEGGARLAERLGMGTSPDTMLREVRRVSLPEFPSVRVLGVDDWALRRGQRYGTILVDLERHRPIDLLPERSSEAFRDWLLAHPGVEIISRDRGDYYIKGATAGAPEASQVADRWHLLHNLQEALVRLVDRYPQELRAACKAARSDASALSPKPALATNGEVLPPQAEQTRAEQVREARRARRIERYQQVIELHQQKIPLRDIARRLELHRSTVRHWVLAGSFLERATRHRASHVDPWIDFLKSRWAEGCQNAAALTAELRKQGFDGSYNMVRRRVAKWRKSDGRSDRPKQTAGFRRLSPKTMAWLMLTSPQALEPEQLILVQRFFEQCPAAEQVSRLGRRFAEMVRHQRADDLDDWLKQAASAPHELRQYAAGLVDDLSAVRAALSLPWSNGQTEGQVNRLKLVKRQMYGRANFDLLRRRFLEVSS